MTNRRSTAGSGRRRGIAAGISAILAIALLLVACSSNGSLSVAAEREPQPTTAPVTTEPAFEPTSVAVTPAPPTGDTGADRANDPADATTPGPAPTPSPVPTSPPDGPCDAGPLAAPNPDRPRYTGYLTVDPAAGTVVGQVDIAFTPDIDIDELYLRLWPNGPRPAAGGVSMTIEPVHFLESGALIDAEMIDPTIARLALDSAVRSGTEIQFAVRFELVVPAELKSRLSGRDDYMRLGTILPLLPWEPGVGWALDPATSLFAEAVSSPVADYRIAVSVPDGYDVLASGVDDGTGTWHAEAARDFALSIGRFRLVTGTAMAPGPVQVTVGVHETLGDDPNAYLAKVIDSLEQFSRRWGQYPWPSLTFALTPNLAGGIEFPTHIMQGPDTIGRTTSHEIGHMFFYSLVGNNQGAAPWLDEGLASYAEFTYEGVGAGAYTIPEGGIGQATQPMTFWESRSDIYYRSVYGQTGFALLQLGSQQDVDCALARYVAANAHGIATANDFIAAFEPTFPDVVVRLASLGVDVAGG